MPETGEIILHPHALDPADFAEVLCLMKVYSFDDPLKFMSIFSRLILFNSCGFM